MRLISSTKSAEPSISPRHDGGLTCHPLVESLIVKPSAWRISTWRSNGTFIPVKRSTLSLARNISRCHFVPLPAVTTWLASPPQISITIRATYPDAHSGEAISNPRSKRKRASEWMFNLRPVVATAIWSKMAISKNIDFVFWLTPVRSPPMMPARSSGPVASPMTSMLSSSS